MNNPKDQSAILERFRKKFPILLDQGGEWGGKPILTSNVTKEVEKWISKELSLAEQRVLEESLANMQQLQGALSRAGKEKDEISALTNAKFYVQNNIRILQIQLNELKKGNQTLDK